MSADRRLTASNYANAVTQIERTRPDLADAIRAYVAALHQEAAMRRVQANRLRAQSGAALETRVRERLNRAPAPTVSELATLIADHVKAAQ